MPSRLRVAAGWAVGALVFALARPSLRSLLLGFPLALTGEAMRVWASGHLEKTRALATGGPYAHTRNPLYLGSVVIAGGIAVIAASPWVAVTAAAYLLAFYPSVIREEEGFLRAKFGEAYVAWAAVVPRVLPRLLPAGPRGTRFDWARVRANREWRTVLALPLLAGLVFLRGWLP